MENTPAADIFETTRLLKAWSAGDETALERLDPLVDTEMRRRARHYLRQDVAWVQVQEWRRDGFQTGHS